MMIFPVWVSSLTLLA